jgi:hypothetical protein
VTPPIGTQSLRVSEQPSCTLGKLLARATTSRPRHRPPRDLPPRPDAATWANVGACRGEPRPRAGRENRRHPLTPAHPPAGPTQDLGRAVPGHEAALVHLARHQKVGAGGPEHRTIPHGEALTSSETAIGWRLNTRRRDEHLSSARERLPSKQTAKFVGHPCKRCAGAMAYRTPPRTTRRVVRWGRT